MPAATMATSGVPSCPRAAGPWPEHGPVGPSCQGPEVSCLDPAPGDAGTRATQWLSVGPTATKDVGLCAKSPLGHPIAPVFLRARSPGRHHVWPRQGLVMLL